jgi:hypothetical protein
MRGLGTDRTRDGPEGRTLLYSDAPKGWIGRRPATATSPEHPGTAVRCEERVYEVRDVRAQLTGAVEYELAPWEDRHTIRVLERYDEEAEGARALERERRSGAWRLRRASILLAPILGHLPGPVQKRMESEFGAPARGMTIASALPLFALGVVGLLAFVLDAAGGGAALVGWPILPFPFAIYFTVESAWRLGIAFAREEPVGSAIGVAAYELLRRFRPRRASEPRGYASRTDEPVPESKEEDR